MHRRFWPALMLVWACMLPGAPSLQAKRIFLQNEVIDPQHSKALPPNQTQAQSPDQNPGLFLVQFDTPPSSSLREELASRGIELLAPIPEDAFIVRLRGKSHSWLRSLPGVLWMGPYKPEHKTHRQLSAVSKDTKDLQVRILVAPGASEPERSAVRASLILVNQESQLPIGTILKGRLSPGRLAALQNSDSVLWIEPDRDMKLMDEVSSKIVAGDGGPNFLLTQSLGYDGFGVKVAVADSGLHNGEAETMHPDLLGRTPAFFFYGASNQLFDAADEHSHGTHVAGIIAGNGATSETDENGFLYGLGVAPGASIIAQRIFDGVGNYAPPPSFERMTRDAKRAGADIGSNSWGDDTYGAYDLSAAEFDALVRDCDALALGDQPYILEFSAGNAGPSPGTIGSPAVGKNVLATGACQNDRIDFVIYGDGPETMADFSSRGPCADGRIKPDVVAPGTYIASLQSASATDEYAWAVISENYQYQGGTSQAGPHASGAAAVFVHYWRETRGTTPSPALVKAALINSAVDLFDEFGTEPVPNMDEGWGRIDLATLFDAALTYSYVDQSATLAQSQVYQQGLIVGAGGDPLKITLAYTDVPGVPSAQKALVNDLDLEVVAPNGSVYRGNNFANGESIPNAPGADAINNVEGVLIQNPVPGQYTVRVRARSILSEARRDTDPIDQDFALVISGVPAAPSEGVISMDRQSYRTPDVISIFLADEDLAGNPTAAVSISSGVEPSGEQIQLQASGAFGAFTGAVLTATGPAFSDGKLQIAHGNIIRVTYFDVSAGTSRTDEAAADLVAPVLSGVSSRISFGIPEVTWTSSEPASSIVYFGTNSAALTRSATNAVLDTTQFVSLGSVVAGWTYHYYVVSVDEAGNRTTNNNNNALYTFAVTDPVPLLLVDGWVDDGFTGVPDLGGYTNALKELGIPYEVWRVEGQGSPVSVLASHRAVIWRLPELALGWSASERTAISNYLHNGGALFVASMEILSRLSGAGGDPSFISNVLHVADFRTEEQGSDGVQEIYGMPLDPITPEFAAVLDYTVYDELWAIFGGFLPSDISDTIAPDASASTFLHDELGDSVGLRWPGLGTNAPGRLILLSFPLDAVPMEGVTANRITLLHDVMSFLAPGASRYGSIRFNAAAYKVPSVATLEVGDNDLAGMSSFQLTVRSTSQPGGVPVTFTRSGAPGQFAGTVELVASNAGPGQLLAADGDVVTAEYFDASVSALREATAMADNTFPVISGVVPEPEYVDAVVYWNTSEPTDSQVLFGETTLLERSAYSGDLQTSHAMVLSSLIPETTYYYKVISRDAAGNVTEQTNNASGIFRFETGTPFRPPWSDDMNTGATKWTTYTDPEMAALGNGNWTLGSPTNLNETAHSPPDCWGTNMRDEVMDASECLLISPAIYLDAGTSAKLKFWHSYDFYDYSGFDIELAGVEISVNNGPLQDLAGFADSSFGWTEETIDLTPYAGNIIFLVWHYALLAFDYGPRPGWLVDDVSISSETFAGGVVRLTNNIWQAEYVLSGPVAKAGKGRSLVVSNAAPGDYTVEFAEVPFYTTPPSQTANLAPGSSLSFTGNYSFTDANLNGISDAWETAFFKFVDPARTPMTDSDGDTAKDYAEFVVGSDPTGPTRPFRLTAARSTGNQLKVEWPCRPGETYTLQKSTNLFFWIQAASPMLATSTVMSVSVPISPGLDEFFRVSTPLGTAPANLPENLSLSISETPGGGARLTWRSPNGCGYLVESSNDLKTWNTASPWIRATARTTTHDLPGPISAPRYYRLRAEP